MITSNTSLLPEVAGDAAILIDPLSEEELASAISQIVSDPALRQTMSNRGLVRAQVFSWEQIARDTLEVYKKC